MLMGTSVYAWEKPVVQTQDFVTDGETEQYIYNVETEKFILGANDWNTRSSVGDKGYKFKITETGEGTYSLTDYVETQSAWKKMFVDSPTGIWVDNNTGANCDSWTLSPLGDGTYNICNTAFPGEMLGVALDGSDTRNYLSSHFNPQPEEGSDEPPTPIPAGYTWASVSVEAYNAYFPAMETYLSAVKLGEALADIKVKYPSVDVQAEQNIYDNEASTKKELDDATASVADKKAKAVAEEAEKNASVDNPMDMTGSIVNATFDKVNDFTGWSGTGWGAGGTTSTCAERYQMTFDTWQELKSMPKGVYKVNVDGFYRAGSGYDDLVAEHAGTTWNPYLYGANMVEGEQADVAQSYIMHLSHGIEPGEHYDVEGNSLGGRVNEYEGETYYLADSMKDFTNYNGTTANVANPFFKTNEVMFPATSGTLRIGVKNESTLGWTIVDNFGLTYYGNGADAWQMLIDDTKKNCTIAADAMVSTTVKDAYDKVVAEAAATDYESYQAAVAAIAEAKKAADENTAAWKAYQDLAATAWTMIEDPNYNGLPELEDLTDAYDDFDEAFENMELTTEQINAAIGDLQAAVSATQKATRPGTDVTDKFLKNTDFSKGDANWTYSGKGHDGKGVAFNANAKCAEAWNSADFDIHQEVANAPVGFYEIQVQGFYRHGNAGSEGWLECYDEDGTQKDPATWPKSTAWVYMNDATSSLDNVYSVQVANGDLFKTEGLAGPAPYVDPNGEYWYANDMTNGGLAFDQGYYQSKAYSLVAKEGDPLKIGVKGSTDGYNWVIFTRFKLIYQGFKAELMKPELEKLLPELEEAVGGDEVMGYDVLTEAQDILANADDAMASEDGKTMFDLLAKVYPTITKINESKALFAELATKVEVIEDALGTYETTATEEAKNAAGELMGQIQGMTESQGEATDAQAKELLSQVDAIVKALAVPSPDYLATASEENPIDMTGMIASPSFEDATGVSQTIKGWTNSGSINFQTQNNDAFGKDGTYYAERWHVNGTLDLNQVVEGLPEGTYVLTVAGHASNGADLYANAEGEEVTAEFTNKDDAAAPATEELRIYVGEGKKLTLGVRGTLTADTWLCVDNFTLNLIAYKEDITGVEDVQAEQAVAAKKVVKFFKAGKINIVKNGKVFNAAGQQVK